MSRVTQAVPEVVVRLTVNRADLVTWTASPRALEALGVGRLRSMGFVRTPDDLLDLAVYPPSGTETAYRIAAAVTEAALTAGLEEREHRACHGCGLRYLVDCRPDLLPARDDAAGLPEHGAFPALFRELYDRSPSRRTTGGHHTTALSDGAALLHVHEVVGRHNGADKAIGSATQAGQDLRRLGLVTTARISGGIAEKAARAGIAWIASRSVPTTLAVEIAEAAGLPVVARAAGSDVRVFARHRPAPGAGKPPRPTAPLDVGDVGEPRPAAPPDLGDVGEPRPATPPDLGDVGDPSVGGGVGES